MLTGLLLLVKDAVVVEAVKLAREIPVIGAECHVAVVDAHHQAVVLFAK